MHVLQIMKEAVSFKTINDFKLLKYKKSSIFFWYKPLNPQLPYNSIFEPE